MSKNSIFYTHKHDILNIIDEEKSDHKWTTPYNFTTLDIVEGELIFPNAHFIRLQQHANSKINLNWLSKTASDLVKNMPNGAIRVAVFNNGDFGFNVRNHTINHHQAYRVSPLVVDQALAIRTKSYPQAFQSPPYPDCCQEWIWINKNNIILEGERSTVWIDLDGVLYTPSLSLPILNGVCRMALICIAEDINITVKQDFIPWSLDHKIGLSSSLKYLIEAQTNVLKKASSTGFNKLKIELIKQRKSKVLDLHISHLLAEAL